MMERARLTLTVGSIGVLLLTLAVGGALAAQDAGEQAALPGSDEPAIVVEPQPDGSAEVAVTYTFDLDDEDQEAAFDDLRADAEAREAFGDRFENRFADVADDAGQAADRDMSVSAATVDVERIDGTGVVTVSVTWEALAATDENRLVVTEPFASGFEPDRPLYVVAPEGYEVTAATPEPDAWHNPVSWNAGSDLHGFEVVLEESDDAAADPDDDGPSAFGPGFGVFAAIAGLLGAALYARRER